MARDIVLQSSVRLTDPNEQFEEYLDILSSLKPTKDKILSYVWDMGESLKKVAWVYDTCGDKFSEIRPNYMCHVCGADLQDIINEKNYSFAIPIDMKGIRKAKKRIQKANFWESFLDRMHRNLTDITAGAAFKVITTLIIVVSGSVAGFTAAGSNNHSLFAFSFSIFLLISFVKGVGWLFLDL
jgi:hypothetical protein